MRIGAHESVAGGLVKAFDRGLADGCEALQIFTGFNTRWAAREIGDDAAAAFVAEARKHGWPLLSHASYLINLATPDDALFAKSIDAMVAELQRCELLEIDYAVLHPGAHVGSGEDTGVSRVAAALDQIHDRTAGYACRILLENTAGQGTNLGFRFDHLSRIIEQTREHERLGVCIDTCHAWAAGYDLRSSAGYVETTAAIDETGLADRICAFHLNDSVRDCGSRVDRHASIGDGTIGSHAFGRIVRDARFADLPAVVETPAEPDGTSSFARNIRQLKQLRRS